MKCSVSSGNGTEIVNPGGPHGLRKPSLHQDPTSWLHKCNFPGKGPLCCLLPTNNCQSQWTSGKELGRSLAEFHSYFVSIYNVLNNVPTLGITYRAVMHSGVTLYARARSDGSTGGYKLNCAAPHLNHVPIVIVKNTALIFDVLPKLALRTWQWKIDSFQMENAGIHGDQRSKARGSSLYAVKIAPFVRKGFSR